MVKNQHIATCGVWEADRFSCIITISACCLWAGAHNTAASEQYLQVTLKCVSVEHSNAQRCIHVNHQGCSTFCRIDFDGLLVALDLMSKHTGTPFPALVTTVIKAGGPTANATTAEYVKYHDDKSFYTGNETLTRSAMACTVGLLLVWDLMRYLCKPLLISRAGVYARGGMSVVDQYHDPAAVSVFRSDSQLNRSLRIRTKRGSSAWRTPTSSAGSTPMAASVTAISPSFNCIKTNFNRIIVSAVSPSAMTPRITSARQRQPSHLLLAKESELLAATSKDSRLEPHERIDPQASDCKLPECLVLCRLEKVERYTYC